MMKRSMSTGALVQTSTYNGKIPDDEALTCGLALSMGRGNIACGVKYGVDMKAARIQRFEQASSKTRVSTQSGRLAVESQKAALRSFSMCNAPSRVDISMSNSCLFQAVGKVMDLDPKTLKFVTEQHLKKTDSFDWGGLDIEAFRSGSEQSGPIVIKALADVLGVRIAVKNVSGSMVGHGDRLVYINFSGSLIGSGGHFYA